MPDPLDPNAPYIGRVGPGPGVVAVPVLIALVALLAYIAYALWTDDELPDTPPGQAPVTIRSPGEQFAELDRDNRNMVRQTFVPELDRIVQSSGLCTKRCSPAFSTSALSQKSWELVTPTAALRIIAQDFVGFDNLQPFFRLQIDQYTQRSDGDPRDDPAIAWLLAAITTRLNFGDAQAVFKCPVKRELGRGWHSCEQSAFDITKNGYLQQNRPQYSRYQTWRYIQFSRRGPFTLEDASWRADR